MWTVIPRRHGSPLQDTHDFQPPPPAASAWRGSRPYRLWEPTWAWPVGTGHTRQILEESPNGECPS